MASAYDKASLVMLPNAYKDGKVYSVKPEDRSGDFTFTRPTAATRVNAAGNIEKETMNLLTNSQNFADSQYILGPNISRTTGQTDPNGGNTAVLMSNPSDANGYFYSSVSLQANTINTFSIYIKGASAGSLAIRIDGSTTGNRHNVNYTTEWTRVSCYQLVDQVNCSIIIGGFSTWTAGQNIQFAFAQVEQGLVARDYIETTTSAVYRGITDNVPRLDYSNGATCPSLLLEPQRTNFINFSEYYGQYSSTRSTITDNYGISPDGSQNAAAVFNTTDNGRHNFGGNYFAVTSGTSYVNSVFAKAGTITKMKLKLFSGGGSPIGFNDGDFDLTNGTATGTGAGIESYGNGWYRCYVVDSPTSSVSNTRFNLELLNASGGVSYVGSVTDYIEIFGSQVEAGSYPTSYIPTYGSSVSRVADACSKTDASDVIGQTEGTVFLDFVYNGKSNTTTDNFNLTLGTWSSNVITIGQYNAALYARIYVSSVLNFNQDFGTMTIGQRYKCAVAYANNDAVFYVNGGLQGSDTSVNVPSVSSVSLNRSGYENSKEINQVLLFKTRLSNAELATLTTI